MKLFFLHNTFWLLSFCLFVLFSHGQIQDNEHLNRNRSLQTNFSVFAAVNYNFSNSSRPPLNFWSFYNYNEPPYDQFDQYYPLLEQLNGSTGTWELGPTIEIGARVLEAKGSANWGAELSITHNSSKWQATSISNGAKADLFFQGDELRLTFRPTFGAQIGRFSWAFQLVLGLGFAKNYESYLIVTEPNGESTELLNDNDNFYNVDYSAGLGSILEYTLNSSLSLGLHYTLYSVNTSPAASGGFLDFTPLVNGFWNNSLGIRFIYHFNN